MDSYVGEEMRMEVRKYAEEFKKTGRINSNPYPGDFVYLASQGLPDWLQQIYDNMNLKPDHPYLGGFNIEGEVKEDDTAFIFLNLDKGQDQLFLVYRSDPAAWEVSSAIANRYLLSFIIPSAVIMVILILLVAGRLIRRLSNDSLALVQFVESQSNNNAGLQPTFHYDEMNNIAQHFSDSMERIQSLVIREKQFLRNASHELRTPIAITRACLDLLERQNLFNDARLKSPLIRMDRANRNMQLLTETLLWLGAEKAESLPTETCNLKLLVDRVCEEHQYLLSGKPVSFQVETEGDTQIETQPLLLGIVLANLIRNACQFTDEGYVKVSINKHSITVEDTGSGFAGDSGQSKQEGFGLGLNLAAQIVEQQGWNLAIASGLAGGARVVLELEK